MPNPSGSELKAANLPYDILCGLFERVAASEPAGWDNAARKIVLGWIVVTHVCRRWRAVCLDIPTLWANAVSAFPNPSVADEMLRRSRDALLHINVAHPITNHSRSKLVIRWGVTHLARAHIFECDAPWPPLFDDSVLESIPLVFACPALRHLRLTVGNKADAFLSDTAGDALPLAPPVVELDTPGLVSAAFASVVPSPLVPLTTLRSLTLSSQSGIQSISTASVLNVLRDTDRLERLVLNLGLPDLEVSQSMSKDHAVVHLPCLVVFDAQFETFSQARDLVECIFAPKVASSSIRVRDETDTDSGPSEPEQLVSLAMTHQHIAPFTQMSLAHDWAGDFPFRLLLAGSVSTSSSSFHDSTGVREVKFEGQNPFVAAALPALPKSFDLAQLRSLSLDSLCEVESDAVVGGPLDVFIGACSGLETLELIASDGQKAILDVLTREAPLCVPMLNTLRLGPAFHSLPDLWRWWDVVQDVLSKRKGIVGRPLQRLVLVGDHCMSQKKVVYWMRGAEECAEQGLVEEVADERTFFHPGDGHDLCGCGWDGTW